MKQMAKGLPAKKRFQSIEKDIERVKWYLWHGNVFMALQLLGDLLMDLEPLDNEKGVTDKIYNAVSEFNSYITNNGGVISILGGQAIGEGFALLLPPSLNPSLAPLLPCPELLGVQIPKV